MKNLIAMFSVAVFFLVVQAEAAVAETKSPKSVRADSRPRLLQKIKLGDYGSKYVRIGDLDGDGILDLLFAQTTTPQRITCLTAIDRNGKVLWQYGKANPKNIFFTCDFPLQVYDWDRDGKNEVIYMPDENNLLTVLNGQTGDLIKQTKIEGGHDSLLFADFSGNGYAQDLLVKDRYKNFWVYDKNLNLLWSKHNCNTGHYPMEYDFDGDGKDELLCGFTLYRHDGKIIWRRLLRSRNRNKPQGHNDAVYIDDMDGDGRAEIALATCDGGDAFLLDADGDTLFRKPLRHSQHTVIGKFRQDLPGKQVWFLDRGDVRSPDRTSHVYLYTKDGKELFCDKKANMWLAATVKIDHWVENPKENFLGLYSRGFEPPGIWDGKGREIATFPLPEAIDKKGAAPGGRDLYDDYYVQHIDCYGDAREEIICYNHRAVYIWTNGAPAKLPNADAGWKPTLKKQPARLYNTNFYPGRL